MVLHPHRYLDVIQADAKRMATAGSTALQRPVPPCPGGDVADVLRHTASVYNHKVAILRLGRQPEAGEWRTQPPDGQDLVAWFRATSAALLEELAEHDPDEWAHTWWPPDHTVGFWYRRMAHETVVHRVDVESAIDDVTDVDRPLALDGIDEVLTIFLGVHGAGADGGRTGAVSVRAEGRDWLVHLGERHVRVEAGGDAAARGEGGTAASLGGEPVPLFLYLWGRGPLEGLDVGGDLDLVLELRRRLAIATQ